MKKTRSLIIMAAILALLLGGFALYKLLGNSSGPTDETKPGSSKSSSVPLVKLEADQVAQITLENESGKILLEPQYSKPTPAPTTAETTQDLPVTGAAKATPTPVPDVLNWILHEPDVRDLSQDAVNDLGNNLLTLSIIEDLGEKSEAELAPFGLTEPQAKAVYKLKDGTSLEIYLGAQATASSSGNYYAMDAKTKRVALVSSAAERMMTSYLSLIDKNVIAMEASDLKSFSMKRQQDDFTIEAVSSPSDNHVQGVQGTVLNWEILTPVKWEGSTMTISNFLGELVQLKAEKFLPYNEADAQTYGLDRPQYEIKLKTAKQEKTLLIGQSITENEAYGMIKGSPYVFTFNRSLLTQTGQPIMDFYNSFAALVNITAVDQLTVVLDGQKYVADIFNPTQQETQAAKDAGKPVPEESYTFNGQNANYENKKKNNVFTKFYQSVIAVKLNGFDTSAKPDPAKAVYSIDYKMRNGDPEIKLLFVPRDEKTLYLIKNGEYTGFYVSQKDFKDRESIDSPGVFYAIELLEAEIAKHEGSAASSSTTAAAAANGA